VQLPAYALLGGVLNLSNLGGGWHASLRIDNLLDRAYSTVASRELQPLQRVPADGRRWCATLRREF
jgi:outer membrane receptor protein involved in Fe transport